MKDIFHGWRRKAGVVSLGLALAVSALWVRSVVIFHGDGRAVVPFDEVNLEIGGRHHRFATYGSDFNWTGASDMQTGKTWTVPFLAVIIPLALLSAYLILWKPRKRA